MWSIVVPVSRFGVLASLISGWTVLGPAAGVGLAAESPAAAPATTMVIIDPNPECFYHRNGAPLDFLYLDGGVQIEVERIEGDRCFFTWSGKPAYVRSNFVATLQEFEEENNKRPPERRFFSTNIAGVVRWVKPRVQPGTPAAKPAVASATPASKPAPVASAPPAAPPSVPLAPPAPKPPPLSPKETGLAFAKALLEGDAAKAKSFCLADTTAFALLDAQAGFMKAVKELRTAVVSKFGEEAAAKVSLPTDAVMGMVREEFAQAREEIQGDTALLFSQKDPKKPQKLKLMAGQWKLDLAHAASQKPAETLAMKQMMALLTGMVQQFAAEIKSGKYASMEEAEKALKATLQPPRP